MRKGFGISRQRGGNIYANWSGVVVLLLAVWVLTGAILAFLHPQWDWTLAWGTALVAPFLLFAAMLAREISGAWVARQTPPMPKNLAARTQSQGFMGANLASVPPNIPVSSLVNDYIIGSNEFACPVIDHGRLVGLVRLTDIRKLPVDKWDLTEVGEIMTSVNQFMEAKNMTG